MEIALAVAFKALVLEGFYRLTGKRMFESKRSRQRQRSGDALRNLLGKRTRLRISRHEHFPQVGAGLLSCKRARECRSAQARPPHPFSCRRQDSRSRAAARK
jgi:hypothetical protein